MKVWLTVPLVIVPLALTANTVALRDLVPADTTNVPVTVEGTVDDMFRDEVDGRWCNLLVRDGDNSILAAVPNRPVDGIPPLKLLGARLRLTGPYLRNVYGARRLSGPRLVVIKPGNITLLAPPTVLPAAAPLDFRETDNPATIHQMGRRSLVGTVVVALRNRTRLLLATDGRNGLVRVDLADGEEPPALGSRVRVSGFPETDLFRVSLSRGRLQPLPSDGSQPELPVEEIPVRLLFTTPGDVQGYNADYFGHLIRLSGTVRTEPRHSVEHGRLTLDCDGYPIRLDTSALSPATASVEPGSKVSVTGVCVFETECWRPNAPFPRVTGLVLVPRTADDFVILARPSWWTPVRLLIAICTLLAALIGFIIWNRALHQLVERRGRQLFKEQIARAKADLKVSERTRLAVELHDSLSQNLTGIAFQLATTRSALAADPSAVPRHLDTAERMLLSCRTELKRCLWDLRGDALETRDFVDAIRKTLLPVSGTAGIDIRFDVPRSRMVDSTAHSVLCIIRELTANAIRHGRAKQLQIAGELTGGRLSFSVRDDGCGFDPNLCGGPAQGHFGLDGIRERTERLGGELSIESTPGHGALIRVSLPLPDDFEDPPPS